MDCKDNSTMVQIIKGSRVSVVFSIIAFSHSDMSSMFSYNGVPCLLDIIAGTGMILKALDEAILCMRVGDEREICIPAVDASQTARALGINFRGLLKYELKVISVVNTPVGDAEIADFFSKRTVTLEALSECRAVKKGPFNISRTYDMFEANAISEEYRILESLHKENNTDIRNSNMTCIDSDRNDRGQYRVELSEIPIQVNSIPFLSNSSLSSRFLIPSWPLDQSKELFLPDLMHLAVTTESRIIVLLDAPSDWDEISKILKISKDENANESSASLNLNAYDDTLDGDCFGGDGGPLGTGPGVSRAPRRMSDISMAVESEETDPTQESVLTWLRVATDSDSSSAPYVSVSSVLRPADDLTSINIVSGVGGGVGYMGDPTPLGYRVALLRFGGWPLGSPPQGRLWNGFWKLFTRAINEVTAAYADKPLSVLLVDVGALERRSETPDSAQETEMVCPMQPNGAAVNPNENILQTGSSGSKSISHMNLTSSTPNKNPDSENVPRKILDDLQAPGFDSGISRREGGSGGLMLGLRWGSGNRAGLFLLIWRLQAEARGSKGVGVGTVEFGTGTGVRQRTLGVGVGIGMGCCAASSSSSSSSSSGVGNAADTIGGSSKYTTTINSISEFSNTSDGKELMSAERSLELGDRRVSAKLLLNAKECFDDMEEHLMSEQAKAKARLAARLRARTDGQATVPTPYSSDFTSLDLPTPPPPSSSSALLLPTPSPSASSHATLPPSLAAAAVISPSPTSPLPPLSPCPSVPPPVSLLEQTETEGVMGDRNQCAANNLIASKIEDSNDKNTGEEIRPSLCVPRTLFDIVSTNTETGSFQYLFVTHAQYKFAYKIVCDYCREHST